MPDWSSSPAVAAAVAALAALLASALTNWANAHRETKALAHQREADAKRLAFDREERRLDRRIDATVALIAELRSQLHAAEKFEMDHGSSPGDVYDYLPLPQVADVLTPVVLLSPEHVAEAADEAAEATIRAVNGNESSAVARQKIAHLVVQARRTLA